jgi:hypothetical protein
MQISPKNITNSKFHKNWPYRLSMEAVPAACPGALARCRLPARRCLPGRRRSVAFPPAVACLGAAARRHPSAFPPAACPLARPRASPLLEAAGRGERDETWFFSFLFNREREREISGEERGRSTDSVERVRSASSADIPFPRTTPFHSFFELNTITTSRCGTITLHSTWFPQLNTP